MSRYQYKIHKNEKKKPKRFGIIKKISTFALALKKYGSLAQLNRASDYGSEGCGFESRANHEKGVQMNSFFISSKSTLTYLNPKI